MGPGSALPEMWLIRTVQTEVVEVVRLRFPEASLFF